MSCVAVYWMPSTHLPVWVSLYCQCTWKWETLVLMVLDERPGDDAAQRGAWTFDDSWVIGFAHFSRGPNDGAVCCALHPFSFSVNTVRGFVRGYTCKATTAVKVGQDWCRGIYPTLFSCITLRQSLRLRLCCVIIAFRSCWMRRSVLNGGLRWARAALLQFAYLTATAAGPPALPRALPAACVSWRWKPGRRMILRLPTRDRLERPARGVLSRFGKGPAFGTMLRDAWLDTHVMNPSVVIMDSCCEFRAEFL